VLTDWKKMKILHSSESISNLSGGLQATVYDFAKESLEKSLRQSIGTI